jgi:hypothetical protein
VKKPSFAQRSGNAHWVATSGTTGPSCPIGNSCCQDAAKEFPWRTLLMRVQQMLAVLAVVGSLTYARGTDQCSILTAADVQQITGEQVHNIAQQSTVGAGGRCANYATGNGKMYLGVSQLTSASDYKTAVVAVPESVYPNRQQLTNVGDEAILMKDTTGKLRYLVARKGRRGVILFPSYGSGISDEQLKKLATLAVSR